MHTMRVLIVDDEAKVCNLVKKLIDWDGLGLELAGILHDGALALARVGLFRRSAVLGSSPRLVSINSPSPRVS